MAKEKSRQDQYIESLKLEIAEELGLLDKIRDQGWGSLNAIEAGRIGGKLATRLKQEGLV